MLSVLWQKEKENILKELKVCDLHEGAIYPEIEKVAEHIKKQSRSEVETKTS